MDSLPLKATAFLYLRTEVPLTEEHSFGTPEVNIVFSNITSSWGYDSWKVGCKSNENKQENNWKTVLLILYATFYIENLSKNDPDVIKPSEMVHVTFSQMPLGTVYVM